MAYGPTGGLGLQGWTSPAPYWNWNWKLNCLVRPEKLLDPRRSRMMLCQASRSNFDLMWPWPLAFCIWAVLTQSALTIICACHVWLKFVRQFSRNLAKIDFFDISASCDPDLWPSDSQSWPFHAHSPKHLHQFTSKSVHLSSKYHLQKLVTNKKWFLKIGLSYNVAVPHKNTACEFGANWYGNGREIRQTLPQQQQPEVCFKFAFGRYSAGCVSALMGPVTLTLKLICESH